MFPESQIHTARNLLRIEANRTSPFPLFCHKHQLSWLKRLKQSRTLVVRNPEHRRAASKFRIGNHNLKIEIGRVTIPKTLEDLRICDHCNLNSVENELHIIFHCDLYNDLRKTLFIKISDRNTLFTNYNIHDKVCFLFNNTDSHISRLTANFVFQAFERRKKQLIQPFHYIFIPLNLAVYCYFISNRYR